MSDEQLLEYLKHGNEAAFALLYRSYFPTVRNLIVKHSGSYADADDIFQESVMILFEKIQNSDFTLTSSLKTYLFSISKNIWLKNLRGKKHVIIDTGFISNLQFVASNTFDNERQAEAAIKRKLAQILKKITENCQRLIKALFFGKESIADLMIKMQWKNRHTANNQKYKCLLQMRKEAEKIRLTEDNK